MAKERGLRFIELPAKFVPGTISGAPIPRGSRIVQELQRVIKVGGGPGEYEEQYKGGATSYTEFIIIWALRQIFHDLPEGGEGTAWVYQESYLGGRHQPGGAVVDFIILGELWNTGLRIQTYYWHFAQGSEKQATDFDQKISLEGGGLRIIDVYEQDFINDETGQEAISIVLDAMAGIERPNPRAGGMVWGSL